MQDIRVAREVYSYETKIHSRSMSSGMLRFKNHFRTALENTLRDAAAKAMIFGIKTLTGKRR